MSEPTVTIPARVVLLAGKHLHHLSKYIASHEEELRMLSGSLTGAVAEQCSHEEVKQVLV